MRLLVDMNMSPRWVPFLRDAGHEAEHWSAVGHHDAADRVVMDYAERHRCVLLTHDLDFGAILAATRGSGPSVVQVRAGNLAPQAIGSQVLAALRQWNPSLRSARSSRSISIAPGCGSCP